MSCCLDLWPDNTIRQDFRITDANDQPVTGATVVATITNFAGDPIGGVAWPVTLTEQGPGVYRLEFGPDDLEIVPGQRLILELVATASGFESTQRCLMVVRERPIACA